MWHRRFSKRKKKTEVETLISFKEKNCIFGVGRMEDFINNVENLTNMLAT